MTITVTAVETYGDTPRVQVTVSSSPAASGALRVWRHHADGTTHRVLAEENAMLVGSWVGLDYHAPFKQDVTYSADAAGLTSAASAEAYVNQSGTWLIHGSDPALSVMVDMVAEVADFTYASRAQKFQVLGRRLPVHRSDYPRAGETGSITVLCESDASVSKVRALFADGGPILVSTPQNANNLGWKWVQPGDLAIKNPGGRVRYAARLASFSYEETTQPDSDTQPIWTYDDLAARAVSEFPTYDDLAAAGYADYDALTLDIN